MSLCDCFNYRPIISISQGKGLRDPKHGCTFEAFFLLSLGGMPGETRANGLALVPLPFAALGIIGQVASRQ